MTRKPYGYLQNAMDEIEKWTFEDAEQHNTEWREAGNSDIRPINQWGIWHNFLPGLEEKWLEGDSKALINAIAYCGQYGLPLPQWCSLAMVNAARKVNNFEARTWSDLFPELAKGRRLHDLRRERSSETPAMVEVVELTGGDNPISQVEAYERVAQRYNYSPAKIKQLFEEKYQKQLTESKTLTEHGYIYHKKPPKTSKDD